MLLLRLVWSSVTFRSYIIDALKTCAASNPSLATMFTSKVADGKRISPFHTVKSPWALVKRLILYNEIFTYFYLKCLYAAC